MKAQEEMNKTQALEDFLADAQPICSLSQQERIDPTSADVRTGVKNVIAYHSIYLDYTLTSYVPHMSFELTISKK